MPATPVTLNNRLRGAEAVATVGKHGARKLPVGLSLVHDMPGALRQIYGVSDPVAEALIRFAQAKRIQIAIRTRNPLALKWIQSIKAVVKPGSILIKSVDEVDAAFLGYFPEDLGLVVLKPPDRALMLASVSRLHSLDMMRPAVLARFAVREKEWITCAAGYHAMARPLSQGGGLRVEFDWAGSGVDTNLAGPNPGSGELHVFDLFHDATPVAGGRVRPADYLFPRIADGSGVLRAITGDIDVVGIVQANGRAIPSSLERAEIYKTLMHLIDMTTPEALSWLAGKEKQLKLLRDHIGEFGERLAVFGPDGDVKTATLNPLMTTFGPDNALIGTGFNGGFKSRLVLPCKSVAAVIPPLSDALRQRRTNLGCHPAAAGFAVGSHLQPPALRQSLAVE